MTPKITFKWKSSKVNAYSAISATYSVTGAPATARIVMQRTFGTARVYKTIATLGRSGTYVGKAPTRGVYSYRLVEGEQLSLFGSAA